MGDLHYTTDAYLWSITKAAQAFKVSRDTVSRRIADAALAPAGQRNGHAVYQAGDLARVVFSDATLVSHGQADPARLPPRERKDWFDSEARRLDVEQRKLNLVPAETLRHELASVCKTTMLFFDTLPDILERDCGLSADVTDRLQSAIDQLRDELANKLEDLEGADEQEALAR